MAIVRDDSQQTNAIFWCVTPQGEKKQAVSASCSIRPNRGLTLVVDVLDAESSMGDVRSEITEEIMYYIRGEIQKAAALGLPMAVS